MLYILLMCKLVRLELVRDMLSFSFLTSDIVKRNSIYNIRLSDYDEYDEYHLVNGSNKDVEEKVGLGASTQYNPIEHPHLWTCFSQLLVC